MSLFCLHRFSYSVFKVGVYGTEVTPVPIPNTEVKLCHDDVTWLATAWESSSMPTFFEPVQYGQAFLYYIGFKAVIYGLFQKIY